MIPSDFDAKWRETRGDAKCILRVGQFSTFGCSRIAHHITRINASGRKRNRNPCRRREMHFLESRGSRLSLWPHSMSNNTRIGGILEPAPVLVAYDANPGSKSLGIATAVLFGLALLLHLRRLHKTRAFYVGLRNRSEGDMVQKAATPLFTPDSPNRCISSSLGLRWLLQVSLSAYYCRTSLARIERLFSSHKGKV